MKNRACVLAAVLLLLSVTGGCTIGGYFVDYMYSGAITESPLLNKRVVVEVTDYGLTEGRNTHGWAYGLIPLMPFGWQVIASPETFVHGSERVQHGFLLEIEKAEMLEAENRTDEIDRDDLHTAIENLKEDYYPFDLGYEMVAVVAYDLYESNLFRDINFLYLGEYFDPFEESVLRYRPEVKIAIEVVEMKWSRYPTFYGLSFAGAAGWLVGFPVSFGKCRMELFVEVLDVSGEEPEPLWDSDYSAEVSCTEWLFYNWRASRAWANALEDVMIRLRRDLKENIPDFERQMAGLEDEDEEEEDWEE
ncbi:MAG: hypothetical protein ACYS8W_01750 [Planctomycetota bacterium]